MRPISQHSITGLVVLMLATLILAACGGAPAAQPVRETVVVTSEPVVVTATPGEGEAATTTEASPEETPSGAFTTPHPILGNIQVRQAIAYCTNRPELIQSVYPFLSEEEQQGLLMDSNVPQGHWALAEDITTYPFDPEQGNALLEEAGWTLPEGTDPGPGIVRTNEAGEPLSIQFVTTDAQFRQTWATVWEQQLAENCGIQIIRTHAPASWLFGDATGLKRRDFETAGYAWVGEPDPKGITQYACNQIPLPSNNWTGQNTMGWCNETASKAIIAANNNLNRERRIAEYATFQKEFTADMISLPLFQRLEAQATNNNLVNFKSDPTEYMTANIGEWEFSDGSDSAVIGFSQEPSSLWTLVTDAAVATQTADLFGFRAFTKYNYDYQAVALKQLPTVENGGATLEDVEVAEGDTVWNTSGEAVELAPGVEVINADGETVTYESGTLTMKQLTVTFEYVDGLTWSDGEPIKQADFELANKINCDPESGATDFSICNSRQNVDFTSDTSYTITYLPGAQWPEYFIYTVGAGIAGNQEAYPSHLELADGRTLADVPASEWSTLPEIAENPLSSGPYVLAEWQKGQRLVFEANPNYYQGEPAVKTVTIQIIEDTNQAVAQLLTGNVDVLEKATLGAGPEVQTVKEAGEAGKVQAFLEASPTWEHIDMNLFIR